MFKVRFGAWIGLLCVSLMLGEACAVAAVVDRGHADRDQQQSPAAVSGAQGLALTPVALADLMIAHQQYAGAIAAYRRIEPRTAYIENKMGIAYQRLSMDEDAKADYRAAIKMDHRYAPAYNNLGTIYFHENDTRGAKQMYRKAIKLDGKAASYWSNLGAAYLSEKNYNEGIEAYQHAFSLNPAIFEEIAAGGMQQYESAKDVAAVYLCFAEVYAQAGMKAEAIQYLRRSLVAGMSMRRQIEQDTQLASLRGMPEFQELLLKKSVQ